MTGRDGLKERWMRCVALAKITGETRALLMYLSNRMSSRGVVQVGSWDDLADYFGVHKRRIAERFKAAQGAGLLMRVAGGYSGHPAVWQAVLPTPPVGAL